MQTLGLSTESKRTDGWLKSIFWPTVENAWDVDYLGQQGFWLCLIIAIVNLIFPIVTGNPILIFIGLFAFIVYFLGGMGVREKSWPAAAVIFLCYLLSTAFSPGVLSIIFLALLLSNVRATFLASEWKQPVEGEDRPTRFNETFRDKLVDVLPAKLWPVLKIPFFALAALWVVFSLLGVIGSVATRMGFVPAHQVH